MLDLIQESVGFVFYLYQNLLLVRLVFYFVLVIVSLSIYLKHKTKLFILLIWNASANRNIHSTVTRPS